MSTREAEINSAATAILEEMISDLILSTAISAHREIKRGLVLCGTCNTFCRSHNVLELSSSSASSSSLRVPSIEAGSSTSRSNSPQPPSAESRVAGYLVGPEKGTGGATGIGSGSGRMDGSGNVFFDCLVCSRPIASNRYAPHLSSCLGFNGGRRGAARSAANKARLGAHDRSSPSPYTGDSDGESTASRRKKNGLNGNGKRGKSPTKLGGLGKKSKTTSGTSTPIPSSRPALPPSKLGRTPTVSTASPVLAPSQTSTASRKTLPGIDVPIEIDADGDEYVPPIEVLDDDSSEGADDDY
ncbi:hypothetical protein BCR39DRAFT_515359 [Naematelia encephala]|uniref:SAGA-associated factor 11 n=1 Tax=Naematelia encephala TaxID=71784 RepID=A0A1Y2BJC3_9TREE|nr:hypothetical protein BCR39DRAFT_515359 [Naematelia encephala]